MAAEGSETCIWRMAVRKGKVRMWEATVEMMKL